MTRVQVTWEDLEGEPQSAEAMLEDISPSGAGLKLGCAIPAGAQLEVSWHTKHFSGTVMYCRPVGLKYLLGILKDQR